MKPVKQSPLASQSQGSALVLVMILVLALSLLAASFLTTHNVDRKINQRAALYNDARAAAEGAAEVATAELDRRARSYSTLPTNILNGFSFPTDAKTVLTGPTIVANSLDFKAGSLSPLSDKPTTLDPTDPFNANDTDKGKPVNIRHSYVYSKATSVDPVTGNEITSYISTLVQIRSQSWLNFGVFGNLDLEFHSGSTMEVYGPVHSNYNIYVTAGGGENLLFYEQCTALNQIIRGYKYNGTVSHTGSVKFPNKQNPTSSELVAMSMNPPEDSRKTGFKKFAETKWKGYVQDSTFDVLPFNPPGLLEYREDDYTTSGVNETLNSAYAMIEPQLSEVADVNNSSSDNPDTNTYAGHKGTTVEDLKFSSVAGLTIRVKNMTAAAWANSRLDNDDPNFDPGFELVYYSGSTSSGRPVNRDNLPSRGSDGKPLETIIPISAARMQPVQRDRLFAAIKLVQFREGTTSGSSGNRRLKGTVWLDETTNTTKEWFGMYDRRQGYQHPTSANSNNNNGYKGAYHVLHIDMGKLDAFLNAPAADWVDVADATKLVYSTSTSYSGVIYVQFPMEPYSNTAVFARRNTDKIRPAKIATTTEPAYALLVRNATRLPQLPSNTSLRDDGLSLVTNGPVYIAGHYNADGSSGTGSSRNPDPGGNEIPALIAADAVTLLSSAYTMDGDADAAEESSSPDDSDCSQRYSALTPLRAAGFTEVSAAIMAGVIPTRLNTSLTGSNNQWMGGVHNYVRFLEDWSDDEFRYRGSMCLLFENEVCLGPWYQNNYAYWYKFPDRNVGYHTYFANGISTPGMPFMRTVRRINVDDITKAEYEAGPPTPPKAAVN